MRILKDDEDEQYVFGRIPILQEETLVNKFSGEEKTIELDRNQNQPDPA